MINEFFEDLYVGVTLGFIIYIVLDFYKNKNHDEH